MAAYGGQDLGIQIFVSLRRGEEWPPMTCDVRIHYDQTIGDLKLAVAKKLNIAVDKVQLFWHKKELCADGDGRTLMEMDIHTGFGFRGYDLTAPPDYWPPVQQTGDCLIEV